MEHGKEQRPYRGSMLAIGAVLGVVCATLIVGFDQLELFLQASSYFALFGAVIGACVAGVEKWITSTAAAVAIGAACGLVGGMVAAAATEALFWTLGLPTGHAIPTFWGVLTNGALMGIPVGILLALMVSWWRGGMYVGR